MELTFTASVKPENLKVIHALIAEMWAREPDVDAADRMLFTTAVAEVATNIIKHRQPGSANQMSMTLRVDADQIEADFADDGIEVHRIVGPERPPDELAESGRGLAIARTALDVLTYERAGAVNRWHLMRRRSRRTAEC